MGEAFGAYFGGEISLVVDLTDRCMGHKKIGLVQPRGRFPGLMVKIDSSIQQDRGNENREQPYQGA